MLEFINNLLGTANPDKQKIIDKIAEYNNKCKLYKNLYDADSTNNKIKYCILSDMQYDDSTNDLTKFKVNNYDDLIAYEKSISTQKTFDVVVGFLMKSLQLSDSFFTDKSMPNNFRAKIREYCQKLLNGDNFVITNSNSQTILNRSVFIKLTKEYLFALQYYREKKRLKVFIKSNMPNFSNLIKTNEDAYIEFLYLTLTKDLDN